MTVVHKLEIGKYDPISHGSNYLYNQFDRIQSFLLKLNNDQFKNILAKPVISNEQVLWYANYDKPFKRISEFGEQTQIDVKAKYWTVRQLLDQEIGKLATSRDTEKQNWAKLLKEVFHEEDNVILTDGTDWCLLWGWRFRNTKENYLAPEFMPKIAPPPSSLVTTSLQQAPESHAQNEVESAPLNRERIPVNPIPVRATIRNKAGLWDRIKRFLRTSVYRLWGLLLLIMFILFLSCLFKYCANKRAEESCKKLEELNRKMLELDKKAQEKCQ